MEGESEVIIKEGVMEEKRKVYQETGDIRGQCKGRKKVEKVRGGDGS